MSLTYLPHYEWTAALGAALLLWCWGWVKPRYGIAASSLLAYASLSAIWVWIYVENRYVHIAPYDQMGLRYFACDSLARLFLVLVPLMALAENIQSFRLWGEVAIGTYVIVNSLLIFGSFATSQCRVDNSCGGLGNPSIMVGASVCMLPLVIKSWERQWGILAVVAIAVVLSKSSIALGLLAIYAAYSLIAGKRYWMAAFLFPLPFVAGYILLGKTQLFLDSGRFEIWRYMMLPWARVPENLPFGMGLGTYHVFAPSLQAVKNLNPGMYWNTLHNDWLQGIFEMGFAGALLMVTTFFTAVYRSVKVRDHALAASLVLYGLYLGVNPGLHHAIPAIFGAWLVLLALKRPNSTETIYFHNEGDVYA